MPKTTPSEADHKRLQKENEALRRDIAWIKQTLEGTMKGMIERFTRIEAKQCKMEAEISLLLSGSRTPGERRAAMRNLVASCGGQTDA